MAMGSGICELLKPSPAMCLPVKEPLAEIDFMRDTWYKAKRNAARCGAVVCFPEP
jgi:hypothetical protein